MHDWLGRVLGQGEYAWHGGGMSAAQDCLAVYFRNPADAEAFHAAFPLLELADGTKLPGYHSPFLPLGRAAVEDEPVCNLV